MTERPSYLWWGGVGLVALLLAAHATLNWWFARGAIRHGDATSIADSVASAGVLPQDADEVCDVHDGRPWLGVHGVRDSAEQERVLDAVRVAVRRIHSDVVSVEFLGEREETLRAELVRR